MQKKSSFLGVFIIAILGSFLIAMSSLGFIIKKVVNENIHRITDSDAQLKRGRLNLLTANGGMSGLLIASPSKEDESRSLAIKMDNADLKFDRASLFADVIVITQLESDNLEIHWNGKNGDNLKGILANISKFSEQQKALEQDLKNRGVYEKQKTLTIDKLVLTNTKLIIKLNDQEQTLTLDPITVESLGSSQEGMSMVDIMKEILKEIISASSTSVSETLKSQNKN